jgi:hypothetical protein
LLDHHLSLSNFVAAGPLAFDQAALLATADATLATIDALATLQCDGFLVDEVPMGASGVAPLGSALLVVALLLMFPVMAKRTSASRNDYH